MIIMKDKELKQVVNEERINDVRHLNMYFEEINRRLNKGGIFKGK